jgi:hypothetical protein
MVKSTQNIAEKDEAYHDFDHVRAKTILSKIKTSNSNDDAHILIKQKAVDLFLYCFVFVKLVCIMVYFTTFSGFFSVPPYIYIYIYMFDDSKERLYFFFISYRFCRFE